MLKRYITNEKWLIPAPAKLPGCKSDDECPQTDTCLNKQCVNPCIASNPCALNGECQALNHRAVCKCPPGHIGDPFINCYKGWWLLTRDDCERLIELKQKN